MLQLHYTGSTTLNFFFSNNVKLELPILGLTQIALAFDLELQL